MRDVPCPVCHGTRLKPEILAVKLNGRSIAEVTGLSIGEASELLGALELAEREREIADRVLKEIQARLRFLLDVGLDYLSLDRPAGDAGRRRGAAHPAGHPDRLRPGRRPLRARRALDRAAPARQPPADRDPGPAAGPGQHADRRRARRGHHQDRRLGRRHRPRRRRARRRGGRQRHGRGAAGQRAVADRRSTSPAACAIAVPAVRRAARTRGASSGRQGRPRAQPQGHRRHLPARLLVAVTGVSGSGKSTLVNDILVHVAGQPAQPRAAGARPAPHDHRPRAPRQGGPRRPVADRPHAAVQPGHLHRRLGPRAQAVRRDPRGEDARLPAGPLLLQRQGRPLRGVLRRRHASRSR